MAQTFKAGGNIPPSRFVMYSADNTVIVATAATDRPVGISAPWSRRIPGESSSFFSGLDDGYVAISGENVTVYGDGDKEVLLELGGTVTAGAKLVSGAGGVATASTTDKQQYCAVARVGGVSGELIPVDVIYGELSV